MNVKLKQTVVQIKFVLFECDNKMRLGLKPCITLGDSPSYNYVCYMPTSLGTITKLSYLSLERGGGGGGGGGTKVLNEIVLLHGCASEC